MAKKSSAAVIFRRDLRLQDNTALIAAAKEFDIIYPVFIFDNRQVKDNEYFGEPAFCCLLEALRDLQKQCPQLSFLQGDFVHHITQIATHVDAIYVNEDYTPFSIKRDATIKQICAKNDCSFVSFHDALLHQPGKIVTKDAEFYKVFTPFYKTALQHPVSEVQDLPENIHYELLPFADQTALAVLSEKYTQSYGCTREQALIVLDSMRSYKLYKQNRDFPAQDSTTRLSLHNKFGTVSIRQVYWAAVKALDADHELVRQLYWRDFFYHVAYYTPRVFGHAFIEKYEHIEWKNSRSEFEAWCQGKTGFPLVDAGMRELNTTGYMHNRTRMVVASFLVKDLHIDWRWGEKYFAQKLVDYDPCVNNGSWQWAASTGCDAQPYFRIFNPWRQQQRFDPECAYIKKYVPELQDIDSKTIHNLDTQTVIVDYPKPIVDHRQRAEQAKAMFKIISS